MGQPPKKQNFKARMAARKNAWIYSQTRSAEVRELAMLFNKITARPYVERFGIKLPALYCDARPIDEIDFAAFPARVVIKPHDGWDSDGVMLIDGEKEIMRGCHVPRAGLKEFVRETMAQARQFGKSPLIAEEFLEDYDPRYPIPRDFKVFVAGGRAWMIQVIDRNGPKDRLCHSFYDRNWQRVADTIKTNLTESPEIEKPALFEELIEAAEALAADLRIFMRLDFYLTPHGVFFGEFTPTPADGWDFTLFADRMFCELMDRHPDSQLKGWTTRGRPAQRWTWIRRAAEAVTWRRA